MEKRLLICDLDNTLYDWVSYFVPCFYAMLDKVVELTRCDREQLLSDFRNVHRKYHDTEHPFSLLETKTVRDLFSNLSTFEIASELDEAFHAFNSCRKKNLKVHEGVIDALEALHTAHVRLVAHTESKLYSAVDRLQRLDLERFFKRIYCRERSKTPHPRADRVEGWLSQFPMRKVRELSHHQRKPDPEVLREICRSEGFLVSESAYVGDSIMHDMLMAKAAGISAIWARYGSYHDPDLYEKLIQISHWTPSDIEREKQLKADAGNIKPDHVLRDGFSEILDVLSIHT